MQELRLKNDTLKSAHPVYVHMEVLPPPPPPVLQALPPRFYRGMSVLKDDQRWLGAC